MGIVEVASLTTRVTMSPPETMTSTLSCTSSAASSGSRSSFSSADRYSMTMFFPSTYPRSRKPCRNASTRDEIVELETETKVRNPIRGTFCASAKGVVDSRVAANRQTIIFVFIVSALRLSNHSIRPCQHVRRDREADLLGCLQIDHQLELNRLLNGEIGGFGAFQNLVRVGGGTSEHFGNARAVIYETTFLHILSLVVHRREPALCRELYNLWSTRIEDDACEQEDCFSPPLGCGSERGLDVLWLQYV